MRAVVAVAVALALLPGNILGRGRCDVPGARAGRIAGGVVMAGVSGAAGAVALAVGLRAFGGLAAVFVGTASMSLALA